MIHIDGQSMLVMDSASDRMRLKDKIVANVAKAIKSIQELQVVSGTATVTLGNYDWQCHRLCEHLDHAMLHGLRHVTPGYWKIVSEFTHKDCIKEIKRMRHVTTDLGRGRAWLFMALNESLLESYFRCYQQNQKLVNQYYVNDALVRDQQRWNIVLTLITGIENAVFQLECDVPYLDLCVYPPDSRRHRAGTLEAAVEFDKLSLCSMDCVAVTPSRPLAQAVIVHTPGSQSQKSDSDSSSTGSYDVSSSNHRNTPSVDSGCHSDWNFRQRSITPIENVGNSVEIRRNSSESKNISRLDSTGSITEVVETEDGELEVIRVPKRGAVTHRHKKKKKKSHNVLNESKNADILKKFDKDKHSVEIPPIDEVKLGDAIMNFQNNNLETSSSDYSLPSDMRSPGDGREIEPITTSPNTIKTSSNQNPNLPEEKEMSLPAKPMNKPSTPTKDKNQPNEKIDSESSKTVREPGEIEKKSKQTDQTVKTDQMSKATHRDSGGFLEVLRARVSSIVEKSDVHKKTGCDNVDSVDKTAGGLTDISKSCDTQNSVPSENTHNVQYTGSHSEPDMLGFYKAGLDATVDEVESADPHIYSGSPINDEENSDIKPEENSVEKIERIYGEPSIYSNDHDSDLCNSDFDENFMNHAKKSRSSHSNSTKEIDKMSASSNGQAPSVYAKPDDRKSENQDLDIYAANNDLESSGSEFGEGFGKIAVFNHDTSSPHHPPLQKDPRLQNKLPFSHSSSNSPSPSLGSRQSPYMNEAVRASPSQKTDTESQRSDDSKSVCSTTSSDVELQGSELELKGRVDELINKGGANTYHHLTFVEEEVDDDEDVIDMSDVVEERDRSRSLCDGEVELDNNSMLFLMLDVIETNETFLKMFCCRQGHTEGKTSSVFILISTDSFYILSQQKRDQRFSKEATVSFVEIDFVSLGFNNQLIHVVCKNRRKQYWFTTGEERVTIAIIDCLASSMEKSESKPAKLEVDTDATTQKISLRKYVTRECRCDASEAEILCYSLVHWEDPSVSSGSCQSDREGNLLYKCNETTNMLGTQTWRPAYAILKDCMLCLYHDKNDPKPQHFLSMGGDQCVGCKRDFNSDRNHSIRVMLADGTYWSIALATEIDANDWIQALCRAISEGLKMSPAKTSNIPCCMILTREKLLMCHEDLDTSFVRTLGSANLVDITAVLNDELCRTFVVLAFDSLEANVSSEKWVLYFNSEYECERFIKALSECWSTYFQIDVPVIPMEDFALQKKCREMADYLKRQLTLK